MSLAPFGLLSNLMFNLLVNATFSLLAGLLIVQLSLWIFRIETGPWKLCLLSLPFLKILSDFVVGIPANSIQMSGIDPFILPPRSQVFSLSAGASWWGPRLSAAFTVQDTNGHEFAASVGDYLSIWTHRTFGQTLPMLLVVGVVSASIFLVARRALVIFRFEQKRREDRSLMAQDADGASHSVRELALHLGLDLKFPLRKVVDIYVSDGFSGSPFTGGVLSPYICLPRNAVARLNQDEISAVIAHELGHVRSFDLLGTLLVQAIGDFFWFVPGYRRLSRRIDRLREVLADRAAVRMGASAARLASALLKLNDICDHTSATILHSAFLREKSLLRERVELLIETHCEPRARFGWQNFWLRWLVAFWIVAAVLCSSLGGNRVDPIESHRRLGSQTYGVYLAAA